MCAPLLYQFIMNKTVYLTNIRIYVSKVYIYMRPPSYIRLSWTKRCIYLLSFIYVS